MFIHISFLVKSHQVHWLVGIEPFSSLLTCVRVIWGCSMAGWGPSPLNGISPSSLLNKESAGLKCLSWPWHLT